MKQNGNKINEDRRLCVAHCCVYATHMNLNENTNERILNLSST